MKKGYTHITLLADRSFSFQSLRGEVIQGVNTFLKSQDSLEGETTLTLVLFDNTVDFLTEKQTLGDVKVLTEQTYVPRNQTALLDAIGTAIANTDAQFVLLEEELQPEMVIFIVLSDGEDVASGTFNKKKIEELVKHRYENKGWEFMFLLCNPDADEIGDRMGALNEQVLGFHKSGAGLLMALESLNRVVTDYRKIKIENCTFLKEDVDKQEALTV